MAKECALSTGNLLRGGLPRNSVDRKTDHPDMTVAVDCGRKALTQPNQPNFLFVQFVAYAHGKLLRSCCNSHSLKQTVP